ncbi:putative quinol monooxygenase [Halodesulfovibrio sp.]|jgi:quinol monooxygenase YgiN|uniref:putative quinol monooxygenase n=1 Tax=Halodesulfovibrio sp. TaxID=1912772 RepID=UPI0025E9B585|nr:putative quinol monooxygenase [Halodesulfovibrio sp.]MCT4627881.1 antibiotic biosynthesis monooxygenase [Halodesulfovibrio sp.]
MIRVIASVKVKEGKLQEFLAIFNANIPSVLEEDGCIEYVPTVDVATSLDSQQVDNQLVTIIEKWESVEALEAHLKAPHMVEYVNAVSDIVEDVALKVLQDA